MIVTFLTYDGLLDPLGKSQILPYLIGLRPFVKKMQIISFEKQDKIKTKEFDNLKCLLKDNNIAWKHHTFTKSKSSLYKLIDIVNFYKSFLVTCINLKPNLIHARGHPMAIFASSFKKIFKFKLIFDCRGMWADEKISKGTWNLNFFLHKVQYNFVKIQEKKLLTKSDYIVFLTEKVKQHYESIHNIKLKNASVIPCAADYKLFNLNYHKIPKNTFSNNGQISFTFGYLGSIGPLYDFKGYLDLIKIALERGFQVRGLVLTNNLDEALDYLNLSEFVKIKSHIQLLSVDRLEVPNYLEKFDYLVSFCKISDSIIGASPTKIGEALALGIPVISNAGVGDIDSIIISCNAGIIVEDTKKESLIDCLHKIKSYEADKISIREDSRKYYDLENAIREYAYIYKFLRNKD